jgi:hypothetical protein
LEANFTGFHETNVFQSSFHAIHDFGCKNLVKSHEISFRFHPGKFMKFMVPN